MIIFYISIAWNPVLAAENNNLEWRMELIESSRALQAESKQLDSNLANIGFVFSSFYSEDNLLNSGVRYAPVIFAPGGKAVRLLAEILYLEREDDFAAFLSLSYAPFSKIYIGAGAELNNKADYHAFIGYNITENIFIEARNIKDKDTEVYPFAGFQISF